MTESIYGIHAVQSLLEREPERIISVYLLKNREDKRLINLFKEIESLGINVKWRDKKNLDAITQNAVHQGIVAEIKAGKSFHENDLPRILNSVDAPFLLVLDGITDPHNLGACIRTADAAGITAIIMPKDKSAPLNATSKKVACGAAEVVPVISVTNLARTLRYLKEEHQIWIIGADGEATHSLYDVKLTGSLAFVMGAEGQGMRRLTKECCDELVSIPMHGLVSSLNVSVATGVCLFEAIRQRRQNN